MKTAGRENPNHGGALPRNRAHGAVGQNSSPLITWAGKQEKLRPPEKCFFLTSPFIELTGKVPGAPTDSKLVSCLTFLNEHLGGRTNVPVSFFKELVNVRDSVVHADSKANWEFHRPRQVAKQYADVYGNVRVEEEDMKKAVQNAAKQVTW